MERPYVGWDIFCELASGFEMWGQVFKASCAADYVSIYL